MPKFTLALFVALAVSLPAAAQERSTPPGWITATNQPCKIWNPAPQPNESVTWSGSCKDGFASGKGVLHWTENGKPDAVFDGEYAKELIECGKWDGELFLDVVEDWLLNNG